MVNTEEELADLMVVLDTYHREARGRWDAGRCVKSVAKDGC